MTIHSLSIELCFHTASTLLSVFLIFTVPNSSCGKVMFSQACVKNSVHGAGACMAWGRAWPGACVAGETATAADGMHPTGIYSCI